MLDNRLFSNSMAVQVICSGINFRLSMNYSIPIVSIFVWVSSRVQSLAFSYLDQCIPNKVKNLHRLGLGQRICIYGQSPRTRSWQKCVSFEGGTCGGKVCTTHKNWLFFLVPFFKSHQFQPVESFKNGLGVSRGLFYG